MGFWLNLGGHFFTGRVPEHYKRLPSEDVQSPSPETFMTLSGRRPMISRGPHSVTLWDVMWENGLAASPAASPSTSTSRRPLPAS